MICFLGESYIYQNCGDFTRMWDFTLRVSDFEELVRVTTISQEFDSVDIVKILILRSI